MSKRASKKTYLITKDLLKHMILDNDPEYANRVVGRALVVIFESQDPVEKVTGESCLKNSVGFTAFDAKIGSIAARYYKRAHALPANLYAVWTQIDSTGYPKICRYWKQLNAAAEKKQMKRIQPEFNYQT